MDFKRKTIDTVTYNTLISSLCKDGRFEDAFDLLEEMEEKKLGPDQYTYNAILGVLTDAGKIKEVEEFMSKMVEMGKLSDQSSQLGKGQDDGNHDNPEGLIRVLLLIQNRSRSCVLKGNTRKQCAFMKNSLRKVSL